MSSKDLPTVDSAVDSLKNSKNLILGGVTAAALLVVLVVFVKGQVAESQMAPWRALSGSADPWMNSASELASIASDQQGEVVEPLAIYWQAVQCLNEGDNDAAATLFQDLLNRFPDHYLSKRALPDPEAADPTSEQGRKPVPQRLLAQLQRLKSWGDEHPVPEANPAPSGDQSVTFVTDRGEFTVTLYAEQAVASTQVVKDLASRFLDTHIVTVLSDQWIELGQSESGDGLEMSSEEAEGFPPYEDNGLSHFAGTVSFKQRPFVDGGTKVGDLKIWLETTFNQDGQSTVIGQVTSGLELLQEISRGTTSAEQRQRLEAPVKITAVRVNGTAVGSTDQAPEATSEEASEDSEETATEDTSTASDE